MSDLVESLPSAKDEPVVASDWVKDGTTREAVLQEARAGYAILARLRQVLASKFQEQAAKEYDPAATERALAMAAGYRKALKDVYKLIQLDN